MVSLLSSIFIAKLSNQMNKALHRDGRIGRVFLGHQEAILALTRIFKRNIMGKYYSFQERA